LCPLEVIRFLSAQCWAFFRSESESPSTAEAHGGHGHPALVTVCSMKQEPTKKKPPAKHERSSLPWVRWDELRNRDPNVTP
jgi:hypothetical protein